MLLKLIEHLKRDNIHLFPQKGVVVDNDDPKKLGRIKCTIKNRWEESDTSKLPWVFPILHYFLGGRPDLSFMSVPEIDTELIIIFPFEDEYSPFYVGYWLNENTKSPVFEEDYPESWGIVDSTPQWVRINKSKPYTEYYNSVEDLVRFDEEGNVWINVPKSLHIQVGENFNLKVGQNSSTKVSGGNILNAEAGISIQTGGNHCIEAAGNVTSESGRVTELKSGSDAGINAAGIAVIEGSMVDINSGIVLGIVDSDVGTLDSLLAELDSKMSDMDAKLSELKSLAEDLKAKRDSAKSAIKEQ